MIFVDRSLAPLLWPLLPTFDTVKHLVVMDDGKGEVPRDANGITVHDYEGLLSQAAPVALRRAGREPGRVDVLHERHHGQPQGRRLLATARRYLHTLGGHDGRLPRRAREPTRSCPSCRCSTPTPGAWPTPRWRAGANLVMPGPDLTPDGHRRPHRGGAGHGGGRCADHLDGRRCPSSKGRDTRPPARHPVRRLGRAQGAVGGLPPSARPADPAGLGHDRDQPGRLGRLDQEHRRATRRRTSWPTCAPRRASPRSASTLRVVEPGTTEPLPWDGEASGELQAKGPWIAAGVLQRRPLAASRSPTTAGCAPATWPRSTPTATSASSTARRT